MAASDEANDLRRGNFRLCRLTTWPNYIGLGFNLENTPIPPHIIRTVESNSPASASGLKILDVVLGVNNEDVTNAEYSMVTQAIKNARDSTNRLDLLVIEKRFYDVFKRKGYTFNPSLARPIQIPSVMPQEYAEFPKYIPRTCEMRLKKEDPSFGFEAVNGYGDVGAYIQEIIPNTPASRTTLRKCDRILEIDDKFVDNVKSETIFDRIVKAKKKRLVKLYVVDTFTYKYFQDNQVPMTSKDYQNSRFAKQRPPQPLATYINVEDPPDEPEPTGVYVPQPPFPTRSMISESTDTHRSFQEDIRLCTITRKSATDSYGIELIYHKREQYHSLKLRSDIPKTLSNAVRAGVKNNDRLIEINGENIENIGENEVKQRIFVIKYPQPLQVLVTDNATYEYYQRQNRVIHSGLPTARRLPENFTQQSVSTVSSRREPINQDETTTTTAVIRKRIVSSDIDDIPTPQTSLENSANHRRQYQLQRVPGFDGYGFTVNSNQAGRPPHKITEIVPNSPAEQQGLRVGDNIITVNDENVQQMNAVEFKQYLKASANNAKLNGYPLLLEVINDDSLLPTIASQPPQTRSMDPPYVNEIPYIDSMQQPLTAKPPELLSSQEEEPKPITIQPVVPRNPSPKIPSTRPTISRVSSDKSKVVPYQNGISIIPTTQPKTTRPYTNGYASLSDKQHSRAGVSARETLNRSRENLTRGTIDVVSRNRLLRYCNLLPGPSQAFGFKLEKDGNNNHIIGTITPDSSAVHAGLEENDLVLEVDNENIEGKSTGDVAMMIRDAAGKGQLRLLIAPSSVKVLSRRSAKSLTALNDENYYRTSTVRSKHVDQDPLSSVSTGRNRSIARSYAEKNYRDRSSIYSLSEPMEPLPRRCVLQYDASFHGCGFRLIEKEQYDTPIIIEVSPNSPAKRSGLTEGDHIIYVESQNVQNFRSFNDIIHFVQQTFEKYGEITLVTITGPGYQVLRRRGGYLESLAFDYQSSNVDQLQPRLCQLKLYNHEYDFGFTLQPNGCLAVKHIEEYSSADTAGLRKDDVVLEINGKTTKYLTTNQIKQIIETSKQERKLDLLVIDPDGHQFSLRHAIPLNSFLPIVQAGEEKRTTTSNHRRSHEPVYL